MKSIILIYFLLLSSTIFAQIKISPAAYISTQDQLNTLYLITQNYISITQYKNNEYISTLGGPYQTNGKNLEITLEYHDQYPDSVGRKKQIPFEVNKANGLSLDGLNVSRNKVKQQDLDGLWRITARQAADKMNTIPKGDRKTIKLLVDGYFQWIAINPAEKGFYGTGGGKYTFDKGKYSEEILFFSRDNSRVGNTLKFEGALKEKQWHHRGKSSKGDPVYEIWTLD